MTLPPLRFRPTFRDYLWGGRRLQDVLGKQLPDGDHWAESWEIVDHGADQSVVAEGAWRGWSLAELNRRFGRELLGAAAPQPRFPLLFKFLDCCRDLSLQVHPDDAGAARLDPPDQGKTEAWVILDAAPGATLWAGLRPGASPDQVRAAAGQRALVDLMQPLQPRRGDCIFVPAGAPHALGAGLLVAEIQQASNTTFRLYDWDRRDADGKPRPLHLEQGLQAIDFELGPLAPRTPQLESPGQELLVACDKFELRRWRGAQPRTLADSQRCHLLAVIAGSCECLHPESPQPLTRGQTLLVPASASVRLQPSQDAELLWMTPGIPSPQAP